MGRIQEAAKSIIRERKELGQLTQKSVADTMGPKPTMVSALLKGDRRLNEDWIEKFCDALGITLGDLEKPTPSKIDQKELLEDRQIPPESAKIEPDIEP